MCNGNHPNDPAGEARGGAQTHPELSIYRTSIAMREFVHFNGFLRLAFDLATCPPKFVEFLLRAAPAVNYLGKRGSFIQYLDFRNQLDLDSTFIHPAGNTNQMKARGHRATLDDFGPKASFDVLNSFNTSEVKPDLHRGFVETIVPLEIHNAGPGFVHYTGC